MYSQVAYAGLSLQCDLLSFHLYYCQPIGNTRTAWSVKEKEFFENYLKEVEVPSGGANSFWNNFAILLNKHCGTARTGKYNLYDVHVILTLS